MDTPSYKKKTNASNNNSYIERQAVKDKQGLEKYEEWTSQMSSSELQELKHLGLDKLKISYSAKGAPKQDAAESSAASYEPDYAAIIDGEQECESAYSAELDALDLIRRLIAELMMHANARLTVDCLALVFGLCANQGESMTDIAKRNGVSAAAVSKRCIDLCEKFGIPKPAAMYTKKAKNPSKKPKP